MNIFMNIFPLSLYTIIKFHEVFSFLISSLSPLSCIVQVETEEDSLSQAAFNQLEEYLMVILDSRLHDKIEQAFSSIFVSMQSQNGQHENKANSWLALPTRCSITYHILTLFHINNITLGIMLWSHENMIWHSIIPFTCSTDLAPIFNVTTELGQLVHDPWEERERRK